MSLYAKRGKMLAKQILWDLGTVVWVIAWVIVAQAVQRLILTLVASPQHLSVLAGQLAGNMSDAATAAGDVPLLGDKLRQPFDTLASSFSAVSGYADSTANVIQVMALVAKILVIVVPIALWVWKWLPARIDFIYQSSKAPRLLAGEGAIELFALRAMATAPLSQLARVTSSPMHAWTSGDVEVIRQLADIELRRMGLGLPNKRHGVRRR